MSLEYRQKGEHFEYDKLKCLRTDYYHNQCSECIDICPAGAFFFDRGKLSLDPATCTNCGVCVGVCPTEALSLEFFDPNDYILQSEGLLSCKKDIPCLSVFDVQHFARLLIEGEPKCDLSHCEECELNPDGKTLEAIKRRIGEAEAFVEHLGIDKKMGYESYEPNRRGFFKTLFKSAKEIASQNESAQSLHTPINRIPVKNTLLKNAIKKIAKDLEKTTLPTAFSFLADKRIDKSCTNCGECVQFCPTDALFSAKEGVAIWFMSGKCIACGICNEVCEPKSIHNEEEIDILEWAFDRGKELIEHRIEICSECKTPFSYKGGEMICERCKSFVDDFGDIFKLASEE